MIIPFAALDFFKSERNYPDLDVLQAEARASAFVSFVISPMITPVAKIIQRSEKEQLTFPPQMLKAASNDVYESSHLFLYKLG